MSFQFDKNSLIPGIAGVSPQIVPIAFVATPPVIVEGESSTLQWTVPPGSTVEIDQEIGDVTSLTDLESGVGSILVSPPPGTTAYTLTYNPPGNETPEVALGPVTVTVNEFVPPPATSFQFTSIMVEGGSVNLEWPAPEGVTEPAALADSIERSTDLVDWTPIENPALTIMGGTVRFTDDLPPPGGKVFYRVERN